MVNWLVHPSKASVVSFLNFCSIRFPEQSLRQRGSSLPRYWPKIKRIPSKMRSRNWHIGSGVSRNKKFYDIFFNTLYGKTSPHFFLQEMNAISLKIIMIRDIKTCYEAIMVKYLRFISRFMSNQKEVAMIICAIIVQDYIT